jgi:tetratricopeptide (TPR) repeat protein
MKESIVQTILFIFSGVIFLSGIYLMATGKIDIEQVTESFFFYALLLSLFSGVGPYTIKGIAAKWGKDGGEIKIDRHIATDEERELAVQISQDQPMPKTKEEGEKTISAVKAAEKRPEKKRSAEDYLILATQKWRSEEFDRALEYVYAGLSLKPENIRIKATLLHRLASIYEFQKNSDLGVKYYSEAIDLDPKFSWPHNNLGNIYKDQKKYDLAEKEYKEALRLEPGYRNSHNNLGVVYLDQEKYDLAEKAYKEALRLNPDYANAHNGLGVVYQNQEKYDLAEKEFKEALRFEPEHANAHRNLKLLREIMEKDPSTPSGHES